MVDDDAARGRVANDIRHWPQLAPSARIEHCQYIALQIGLTEVAAKNLHVAVWIDKSDMRRNRIGIHNPHRLSEGTQGKCEADLAPNGIAVGPHMTGQHERLCFTDNLC